jgi:hypothetical protein
VFGLFRKRPANESFWQWLATNTSRIQFGDGSGVGSMAEGISRAFKAEYPGLVWEISPAKSGPWLFCVSADGNKELFSQVQQAVRVAPKYWGQGPMAVP